MDRDEDIALIERAYRLWREGRYEDLFAICTEDVEWIPPAYALQSGPQVGTEALRAGIRSYEESFDEFWPEPEEILPAPTPGLYVALVKTHARGRGSGAAVTISVAHIFTIDEGRVARFEVVIDRGEALRKAGIEPGSQTPT